MADDTIEVVIRAQIGQLQQDMKSAQTQITGGMDQIRNAIDAQTKALSNSIEASMRASVAAVDSGASKIVSELGQVRSAIAAAAVANQPLQQHLNNTANQLNHVAHSSTGVRRELIVLAHEMAMGNYSRFAGSMMVIGERMDILSKVMSPTGLGIAAVIGAVVALGVAAAKGALELEHFQNALKLTGSYAGITFGEFNTLAREIADGTSSTIGSSKALLQQLVASGQFTREELKATGEVITKIAELSGEDADKVATEFSKMHEDVARFASEHMRQFGGITAAQIAYIKELQRTQGAVVAAKQYEEDLDKALGNTTQNLGFLERAFHATTSAVSDFWDMLKGVGRDDTPEERIKGLTADIAKLEDQIRRARAAGNTDFANGLENGPQLIMDRAKLRAAEIEKNALNYQAQKRGEERQHQVALDESRQYHEKLLEETKTSHQKMLDELAEYQKRYNALSPEERKTFGFDQAKDEAAIRAKYAKGPKADPTLSLEYDVQNAYFKASQSLLAENLKIQEQMNDSAYRKGAIGIKQYYDQKIALQQQGIAQEIEGIKREISQTEALEGKATDPRQKGQFQVKLIELNGQLQLAEKKRTDAAIAGNQELNDALQKQADEIEDIQDKAAERSAQHRVDVQRQMLDRMRSNDQISNQQYFQMLKQLEDQEYQRQLAALQDELKLAQDKPVEYAKINDQIEALEQDHQDKMREIDMQSIDDQKQMFRDLYNSVESSFGDTVSRFLEGGEKMGTAWHQFAVSFSKDVDDMIAKLITQSIFGGGGSGPGLFGGIFGGGNGGASGGGSLMSMMGSFAGLLGGSGGSSLMSSVSDWFNVADSGGVGSAAYNVDNWASAVFSSGGGLAQGGYAAPSTMYEVAENGPETLSVNGRTFLMMGSQGGQVTPAVPGAGGSGHTFNTTNNFTLQTPVDSRSQSQLAAAAMRGGVKATQRM